MLEVGYRCKNCGSEEVESLIETVFGDPPELGKPPLRGSAYKTHCVRCGSDEVEEKRHEPQTALGFVLHNYGKLTFIVIALSVIVGVLLLLWKIIDWAFP